MYWHYYEYHELFNDKYFLRYRVKILNSKKNDSFIYQGIVNEFQYDKLLASTAYTFELCVIQNAKSVVLDRKTISVTTPLSSMLSRPISKI